MTESERPYDPPPEDEAPPGAAEAEPGTADGPLTPEEADDDAQATPRDETEERFKGG